MRHFLVADYQTETQTQNSKGEKTPQVIVTR